MRYWSVICAVGSLLLAAAVQAEEGVTQTLADAPLGGPLEVLQAPYRLGSFTHFAQIMPARPIARGGPVAELPLSLIHISEPTRPY